MRVDAHTDKGQDEKDTPLLRKYTQLFNLVFILFIMKYTMIGSPSICLVLLSL